MPNPLELALKRDDQYERWRENLERNGNLIPPHDFAYFLESGFEYWRGRAKNGDSYHEEAGIKGLRCFKAFKGGRELQIDFCRNEAMRAYTASATFEDQSPQNIRRHILAGHYWIKQADLLQAEL